VRRFRLDTKGAFKKRDRAQKIVNTEWEDYDTGQSLFYIGDFGNNVSGNRKDLRI
jgi:hypothetical protein